MAALTTAALLVCESGYTPPLALATILDDLDAVTPEEEHPEMLIQAVTRWPGYDQDVPLAVVRPRHTFTLPRHFGV
jgi:hypothetical protein